MAQDAIMHVVGARPNFPKAAPVIRALRELGEQQVLVHTGQHYDDALSEVFFRELDLPRPDINMSVGSGSHARQTAAIMTGFEDILLERRPRCVVVYGDVNSTVAAALVASKMQTPVAHVEAGLRSFDWTMPEEINRVVTDRLASILFATSDDAVEHLRHEGVADDRVYMVGNPMIDTLLTHLERLDAAAMRAQFGLDGDYAVATMHRPANVDSPESAGKVVSALHGVAELMPLVMPIHPRGRGPLEEAGLLTHPRIVVVEPMPYTHFLGLVRGARLVVTDSGGLQEETTVLGVPCLTLRPNTERPVTITHGTNVLATPETLLDLARDALTDASKRASRGVPPLWDGAAGPRIAKILVESVG